MESGQKSCFVIMGFGQKTDFQSNPPRVLDLDKTFEYIIQPAVLDAGLVCVRADQILHSTLIDKPTYELLLNADVVIADLSTSNANAIYELGLRHALRPKTTIVMADDGFRFPFDLAHMSIIKYKHLGVEIGFGEVNRVRRALTQELIDRLKKKEIDSPIYLFLPSLNLMDVSADKSVDLSAFRDDQTDDKNFANLVKSFQETKSAATKPSDWLKVVEFLDRLRAIQPHNPYYLQQLALATYKSELPDKPTALHNAKRILEELSPTTSADPETVGIWGAVHKRLWQIARDRADLDSAVRAYERGFLLKDDYYNGINYAFMLDVRATLSDGDESIADRVLARRARLRVLQICDDTLKAGDFPPDEKFWIGATKVEALFGLGRKHEAEKLKTTVIVEERNMSGQQGDSVGWMEQSLNHQLEDLEQFLSVHAG